ncbi:hypothetical protein LOTGIDRAFT_161584 [Lottia gigantea]|uniref:L-Fucosyltransferase n=1 Tax=Lottia gigantea TaxID=225164 RepID=V4A9R3_LOTGI|nr:hypothetical protein LOTGIDRAFT_161584 [Lottia gigantea]ESO93482.1 hypothetical protein LOTGIDRAFT_161584 [Lottia gigantea]
MPSINFGGRKRKLRKSSVIILVIISIFFIYRVYMNYFYRHNKTGICYNDQSSNSHKLYLTVSDLGHSFDLLMFQYASLLGLGNLKNRRILFPADTALENIFNLKYISSDNTECWFKQSELIPMAYDETIIDLPERNVTIAGFLQSWKYFYTVEQTVRQEFRLKGYILKMTQTRFNKFIANADEVTVIGIHVSRSHTISMNGISQSNIAPISYIQKAMKHMRDKFKNVKFLAVCDDINWCQAYIKDHDVVIVDDDVSPESQLAMLSICDHSIITVSTLGYWGAWLAKGYVVYYKDFIRENSALGKFIRYEDFFPAQWISIGS